MPKLENLISFNFLIFTCEYSRRCTWVVLYSTTHIMSKLSLLILVDYSDGDKVIVLLGIKQKKTWAFFIKNYYWNMAHNITLLTQMTHYYGAKHWILHSRLIERACQKFFFYYVARNGVHWSSFMHSLYSGIFGQ